MSETTVERAPTPYETMMAEFNRRADGDFRDHIATYGTAEILGRVVEVMRWRNPARGAYAIEYICDGPRLIVTAIATLRRLLLPATRTTEAP